MTDTNRRAGGRNVALRPTVIAARTLLVATAAFGLGGCRDSAERPLPGPAQEAAAHEVARPTEPPPPPGPLEAPDPKGDVRAAVSSAGGDTRLEPLALLPFAAQRARSELEDAALVAISCFPVREDGRAELSLVAEGRCSYTFRSPEATRRRPELPIGIRTEARCIVDFTLRPSLEASANVMSRPRADCRRHHFVATPACTFADVWSRALAAGAPTGAVATVRLAARHRSLYDPPDPEDEPDVAERGLWQLRIDRDDGPDLRFETWDDCGSPPPSADEKHVAAAVARLRPALRTCFARAAGRHASVEAFELAWRLTSDDTGRARIGYAHTGVDIEGIFQGSLGEVRSRFDDCARAAFSQLRLPRSLGTVRLVMRVERDGRPQLAPPPYR